jgi:hypothetical protein
MFPQGLEHPGGSDQAPPDAGGIDPVGREVLIYCVHFMGE